MGASASKQRSHGTKRRLSFSSSVPDRPSPPGKPQLVPGTPHSEPDVVTIRWDPPVYDGGSRVTGYLVEHRRTGSPHWVRASPTLVRLAELTLSGLEPGWRYQFRVSAQNSAGLSAPGELSELLTVTLQRTAASAPHFITELRDTVATENDKAELTVEVRGTPMPTIAWYKDGMEVFSGRRHRIVTDNGISSLVIHQTALSDEGEIKCTATNRVGHAVTKATLRMQAPPSIRLPRQYEEGLLFEKDEVIRLKVTVAGKPVPTVTWQHNGEPVSNSNRYEVATNERHATLRIDEARRSDRGEYQVRAVNQLGEDIASFLVTVTDKPQAPGQARVVMTLGRSVTLSWAAPEDDGGCKIGNYIVEYYRIGWNMWLKAATCRQLTTTLGDLIEGSEYKFRVKAENPFGVSDPGEESDVLFIPDPQRGLLTPPEHRATDIGNDQKDVQRPGRGIMDWLSDSPTPTFETLPVSSSVSPVPERTKRKVRTPVMSDDEEMRPDIKRLHVQDKPQDEAPKAPKRKSKVKELTEEEQIFKKTDSKIISRDREVPREKSMDKNDMVHGSSEFMLVLLPESRATTEEREETKSETVGSVKEDAVEIPPPMSLSAPELGCAEPEVFMQRAWFSSTELLHERAMARFYQAVAEEEAEKALLRRKRYSVDRRPSTSSTASSHGRGEITAAAMFARSVSQEEIFKEKKRLSLPEPKPSMQEESETWYKETKNKAMPSERKYITSQPVPQKQQQQLLPGPVLSRSTQRQLSEEESVGTEEEYEEYEEEEEEEEEEMEEEEDYTEEIDEENEYEMEEEAEEEDIEEVDMLGESEGEYEDRPPKFSVEEDTYHPRNMIPRSVATVQSRQSKNIANNLKSVTKVATAVVSHSIKIPVGLGQPSTSSSKGMSNLKPPIPQPPVRIEVTPPPHDRIQESKPKHVIKSIIKKQSTSPDKRVSPDNKTENNTLSQQFSPPRFTPDGRHLPNLNPPLPKPILKIREHSEERLSDNNKNNKPDSAPIAAVEPELNIITKVDIETTPEKEFDGAKKKKQVRIEEPENRRPIIELEENEASLQAAGNAARNRRNRYSSPVSSLPGEEADPTKCLIHHYSDIVREFGQIKKAQKRLYLNYEDLKAAAQTSEEAQFDPILAAEEEEKRGELTKDEKVKEEGLLEEKEEIIKEEIPKEQIAEEGSFDYEEEESFPLDEPEFHKNLVKEVKVVMPFVRETRKFYPIQQEDQEEEEEEEEKEDQPVFKKEKPFILETAEKKVHSLVDYMTDVAMFVVACWLYAFKDERLAIPILILMIYRQAKDYTVEKVTNTKNAIKNKMQSIKNKLPARWTNKSE